MARYDLALVNGVVALPGGSARAPMLQSQLAEIPALAQRHGVTSFKYYMFYKGLDLAGASLDAASYTMAEHYDLGHLYEIMEAVAACRARGDSARVSVSIHCEQP